MRKEFKSVKLEDEGLRKLDSLAKATGLTKSQVIMRYLPSAEEAKKDKLNAHFEELKGLLPEREGELDYMRLLLLRSEDLPGELREQYGELITSQLKEFVHLILEMKEGILPKGRTHEDLEEKTSEPFELPSGLLFDHDKKQIYIRRCTATEDICYHCEEQKELRYEIYKDGRWQPICNECVRRVVHVS